MPRGILTHGSVLEPIQRMGLLATILLAIVATLASYNLASAQQTSQTDRTGNPSARPLVTFNDGQLTINANNVSLAEIMSALRACTGADIDIPANASAEHVTAQLGPGPARKILSDLLGWSTFDFIIRGSDDDPLAVQSVTLLERSKGPAGPAPRSTGTVASVAPASAPPAAQPDPDPASSAVAEVATPTPETRPDHPDALSDKPSNPSSLQSRIASSGSNTAAGPALNGSMGQSPADMIQQLQQMYEQRRIMQQQENQSVARSGH